MTKAEAIIAMEAGEKVTHRWFSPDEWITMENGEFLLEDGVRCSWDEFWRDRFNSSWEIDWEIWKPIVV